MRERKLNGSCLGRPFALFENCVSTQGLQDEDRHRGGSLAGVRPLRGGHACEAAEVTLVLHFKWALVLQPREMHVMQPKETLASQVGFQLERPSSRPSSWKAVRHAPLQPRLMSGVLIACSLYLDVSFALVGRTPKNKYALRAAPGVVPLPDETVLKSV
eukprot:scaffold132778_cov15-Tisochrysis_lutea.AAC.2